MSCTYRRKWKNEYLAEYATLATLAKAKYESEKEKKRQVEEEKQLRAALPVLTKYLRLLKIEKNLRQLTTRDMKTLLAYIVPLNPNGEFDNYTKYGNAEKMRNRLGITIDDEVDCLSQYFPKK